MPLALADFIQALPKTETHLHVEGALPYELLTAWDAARYPADPPFRRRDYRYATFPEFEGILLDNALPWFTTAERYYEATRVMFAQHLAQNVRYVETSFHLPVTQFIQVPGPEIIAAIRAAVPAGLSLPRPFSATDSGGAGLGFRVPAEGSACTDPAFSVLQGLHEAWIPLPDTLVMGREWSDTVRTVSCRDRVPLRGVSVRRFRVVRGELQDGRVVVMIERRAKGQVAGSGDQFGERVELDGSSSGTVLYALDASSGRLLRASGTSLVELRFKSRRRNQRVRQESELSFVFRP